MSSEVCPYCGKTYKRLKSHLSHCKAAPTAKTTKESTSLLDSKTTGKGKKSVAGSRQNKKDGMLSESEQTLISSPLLSAKKKKVKDQIKTDLSSSTPLVSKKKSLRAQIEAAKSQRDVKGSIETTYLPQNIFKHQINSKLDEDSLESVDFKARNVVEKKKSKAIPDVKKNKSVPRVRDNFWVESEEEEEGLRDDVLSRREQTKITLQDVKATLGRVKTNRTTDVLTLGDPLSEVQTQTKKTHKQAALIVPLNAAFPQPPPPSRMNPPLPPPVMKLTEELKTSGNVGGLLSKSPLLAQFSTPLHFQPPTTPPERTEKLLMERANPVEASPSRQRLAEVRLRELPEWLAVRTPSRPRDLVETVQRGWRWYYRRYIDVKKGGVGGVGMLLAGYCVLSYIWSFPHTKLDRWRKYH